MKTPNKYDPQTCSRKGEAKRRFKAIKKLANKYYKQIQSQRDLYYQPPIPDVDFIF